MIANIFDNEKIASRANIIKNLIYSSGRYSVSFFLEIDSLEFYILRLGSSISYSIADKNVYDDLELDVERFDASSNGTNNHPFLNRAITAREAARIQSFDDSFEFLGKVTTGGLSRRVEVPQYTQVGNAVPPLLARTVVEEIKKVL